MELKKTKTEKGRGTGQIQVENPLDTTVLDGHEREPVQPHADSELHRGEINMDMFKQMCELQIITSLRRLADAIEDQKAGRECRHPYIFIDVSGIERDLTRVLADLSRRRCPNCTRFHAQCTRCGSSTQCSWEEGEEDSIVHCETCQLHWPLGSAEQSSTDSDLSGEVCPRSHRKDGNNCWWRRLLRKWMARQ